MGVLVHLPDPFSVSKRNAWRLDRPVTVRRLVQRHRGLAPHTRVYRPGGVYGRRKVREFVRPTVCLLNGVALGRQRWKRTVVGADDVVSFHTPLSGGNISPLQIILAVASIAILIAAPYLGALIAPTLATTFGVSLATATTIGTAIVGIGLSAVAYGVSALFAPPAPPTSGAGYAGATPASSPVYNLTAQGNYARLQSPIPEAFGLNRMFPDFVGTPYATYSDATTVEDSSTTQYLHHIVGLGIGEFEIDEASLKLGDTPIASYPDIQWAVILPGALPDIAIADERWIVATDLADIELLDAVAGSPWGGPFAANPAQTTISRVAVDMAAPRGLWAYNPVSTGLDYREVTYVVEAQPIDDNGSATGAWETFAPVTVSRISQDPQRFTTELALPAAGRWQVRVKRTDFKDDSLQSGHQLDWIGLRGRSVGRRSYPGMTCISLKMKAGAALNAAQARQFNLLATRMLPTWDGSAMTTTIAATRSPCDAFAYIARTANGGRLRDDQIALADLYASKAEFAASEWTFDFVFDGALAVSEALGRVARAVIAERVTQGGQLRLVRDVPVDAPVAMFSPRNIAAGSLSIQYMMVDSTSPDCLIGEYIDQTTWKPRDVTVAFDDSEQLRPSRLTLHGVGNREQARAVLWNLARGNRYRRRVIGFTTPMEGLAASFGDGISFSHDVPNYGQTLEVIDCDGTDPNAPVLTFVDPPAFGATGPHYYVAVRNSLGQKAGPFRVHRLGSDPLKMRLVVPDPDDLPEILIGGDRERTWVQFGIGEAYAKPLKVKQVTPRDALSADLIAFDDDPRMFDPLPDEPEVPIGASTDPIAIAITNADGPLVNLRTLANANDYSGLVEQQVTFSAALGVDVAIERGSWPAFAKPILQLAGALSGVPGALGAGGLGGTPVPAFSDVGNGLLGGNGGAGGTALDATSGALAVTGAGDIRGGTGGGGGGGGGGGTYYETTDEGSGATGHQLKGGDGGDGSGAPGEAGVAGGGYSSGAGGTGGAPGTGWASAGSAGANGTAGDGLDPMGFGGPSTGGAGGAGGAAGKAIVGFANLDLSGFTGTIVGATS